MSKWVPVPQTFKCHKCHRCWHVSLLCPCGTQTVTVLSADPVLASLFWLSSAHETRRWGTCGGPSGRAAWPWDSWRVTRSRFGGHTARPHLPTGGTLGGFGSGGCQAIVLKALFLPSPHLAFQTQTLMLHFWHFTFFIFIVFSQLNLHLTS